MHEKKYVNFVKKGATNVIWPILLVLPLLEVIPNQSTQEYLHALIFIDKIYNAYITLSILEKELHA
jgi:hypothetical protein